MIVLNKKLAPQPKEYVPMTLVKEIFVATASKAEGVSLRVILNVSILFPLDYTINSLNEVFKSDTAT